MSQWRHFIPMCISLRIPWELGHQLLTSPVRTTLFAPAVAETTEQPGPRGAGLHPRGRWHAALPCSSITGGPRTAHGSRWQPTAGVCCSIRSRRPCPLRKPPQWSGAATAKPRQGSRLVHPVVVGSSPLRGVIGVEGSIGRLASSSCVTNGWRSRYSLQRPRSPGLPNRFPVLSGLSIVSAGKNGSLAMRLLSPLDRSRSS